MITPDELLAQAKEIEQKICYTFNDPSLLILAFTHRSYINENRDLASEHNERLEFLGDSVIGLLTADYLYHFLRNTPEGELSHIRSRLVEAHSCHDFVQKLGIEQYLLLGRGEQRNDGRGRESILADLFEAIIGAIFIDGGLPAAKEFLFRNFTEEINKKIEKPPRNWKADLQDYAQKTFHVPPLYKVKSESGPDHSKTFNMVVTIDGKNVGEGHGSSKKEAEQSAAADAMLKIKGP